MQLAARFAVVLAMLWLAVLPGRALAAAPAARPATTKANCSTVSVHLLDVELAIQAVSVNAARPGPTSLICSYFGASGRLKNEATIVYLRATPAQFAAIVAREAKLHHMVKVPRIAARAYAYVAPPSAYVYLLTQGTFVQAYAAVPEVRVEALARRIVALLVR